MRIVDPKAVEDERRAREGLNLKPRNPSLLREWHDALDRIWGPALGGAFARFRQGDISSIPVLVAFLEEDPFFFRSGYVKGEILQRLRPEQLTEKQIEQLRSVCLRAAKTCGRREYRRYCRLAVRLADLKFAKSLEALTTDQGSVASRARMMLRYVAKHGPQELRNSAIRDLSFDEWAAIASQNPEEAVKRFKELNMQRVEHVLQRLRNSQTDG